MTLEDVKRIIKEENLVLHNLEADQPLREEQVVLRFKGEEWSVFATDERTSIITGSIFTYKTEAEALDSFLKRLRAANRLN